MKYLVDIWNWYNWLLEVEEDRIYKQWDTYYVWDTFVTVMKVLDN